MNNRWMQVFVIAGGLAIAIHLDWHAARHGQRLSLGWRYHWLLAIPVFAVAAVSTVRWWRDRVVLASVSLLALAVVLGQLVEPLVEAVFLGSSFSSAFRADRLAALGAFMGAGLVSFVTVIWWVLRREAVALPPEPTA